MVEINNQRKAFLDMLAWSEESDNGRQKNQKSWLWRHCRRRAIYWLPDHPQNRHAKPKTQINRRRTLPASFPLVGCLPQAAAISKTSLRKVRTLWHWSRLRSVALYLWLIVVDICQAIDRCSNIWASPPGAGYGQFEHKADSLIAKSQRSGRERSEIDVWAESPRLFWFAICIIVCLSWAVNHYRDNAITYKAQRDKNARRIEAGERGNYWRRDALAWCCCAWCKIHEGS